MSAFPDVPRAMTRTGIPTWIGARMNMRDQSSRISINLTGRDDWTRAVELMHVGNYQRAKAAVMRPIDDFFVLADERGCD